MIRSSLATLAALGVAAVVAWRLGGTLGAGCLAGFFLGAAFTGLGSLYQRHMLLTRPERALFAMVVAFLAKLAVVVMGTLTFRFVEVAAERVDWRSFAVAFAAAVAVLLPLGTLDAASAAKRRESRGGSSGPSNPRNAGEAHGRP